MRRNPAFRTGEMLQVLEIPFGKKGKTLYICALLKIKTVMKKTQIILNEQVSSQRVLSKSILMVALFFVVGGVFSQNYNSIAGGLWSSASNWLRVSNWGSSTPPSNQSSGVVNVNHELTFNGNYSAGSATINVNNGSKFIINGNGSIGGGGNINVYGTLEVNGTMTLNGNLNVFPGGQVVVANNFTIFSSEYLRVGTSTQSTNYADLIIRGNLVSKNSGDFTVNSNGRLVVNGNIEAEGGGTIFTIGNGGQAYVHGNIQFSGGGSNIVNNNSVVPFGLYVNGSVSNSGGGSSTSVNRTNLNTMYSSNQSFFDWISQTPNSPVTENNLNSSTIQSFLINGATGNYSLDFNQLASSGTSNVWSDNTTVPFVFAQTNATSLSYRATNGSSVSNGLQAFRHATINTNDKSLGSICSSSTTASNLNNFAYGILMKNNTSLPLSELKISYTMEQWFNAGTNVSNQMSVWYKVSDFPITSLTPQSNAGWIQLSNLTATTPTVSSVQTYLDGNSSVNKVSFSNVVIPNINLAPGKFLMLRWLDVDDAGRDHGISIDDVSFSWNLMNIYYRDADGDGFGDAQNTTFAVTAPSGFVTNNLDCNDNNPTINPNAIMYKDADGDGFGDRNISLTGCGIVGFVYNADDCNDNNFAVKNSSTLSSVGSISGVSVGLCTSNITSSTFSINEVDGASNYVWTVPTGMNILSGQGSRTIDVSINESYVGGLVLVSASNYCSTSVSDSLITRTVADRPLEILGNHIFCTGGIERTFTTPELLGATSYNWTVPTGFEILSGQGTNTITVKSGSGFDFGPMRVSGVNGCGEGLQFSLWLYSQPRQPNNIQGVNVGLCPAQLTTTSYTLTTNPSATSYLWTVPTGMTILSGQGTSVINVAITAPITAGTLSIQGVNACGVSQPRTLALTTIPARPVAVLGTSSGLCPNGVSNTTYSVAGINGATSYVWTVPSGVAITSGQGTSSINASFGSSFTSGTIAVAARNNCGTSATRALTLNSVPVIPGNVSGNQYNVCSLMSATQNYSVVAMDGVTSYTWTVPTGMSVASGQGTNAIVANVGSNFSTGNLVVVANNACGTSAQRRVVLYNFPVQPASIAGNTSPCGEARYSVEEVSGAISYAWTLPSGGTINEGHGTSSIRATFNSNVNGSISCRATNACTNSWNTGLGISTNCGSLRQNDSNNEILVLEDEKGHATEITAYPNPFEGSFTLNIASELTKNVQVEIKSLNGSTVYESNFNLENGELLTDIESSTFVAGVYFVNVRFDNGMLKTLKIIKK
ncbi:MAG: hypothetical protein RL264_812 [Bacteroidota bacterium]